MKRRVFISAVAVCLLSVLAGQVSAAEFTVANTTVGGTPTWWATPTNWTPSTAFPNAVGDIAWCNVDSQVTEQFRVGNGNTYTLGQLIFGDTVQTSAAWQQQIIGSSYGEGTLILDNGGAINAGGVAGAYIRHNTGNTSTGTTGTDSIRTMVVLNDNLLIDMSVPFGFRQGAISETGGPRSIKKTGTASLIVGIPIAITGGITISGGRWQLRDDAFLDCKELTLQGSAGTDAIQVSTDSSPFAFDVNINMGGRVINNGGTTTNFGSIEGTAGIFAYNGAATGTLTLNGNYAGTNKDFAGEIKEGDWAGPVGGMFTFIKQGAYTQTLSGANDNQVAHVQVQNGVLALNKTAGKNAIGLVSCGNTGDPNYTPLVGNYTGGNDVSISGGAELRLLASNQIIDNCAMTLGGGKFNVNGQAEVLGTLTVSSSSNLDLLAGTATSMVTFANSSAMSWSGTLTVQGWDGSTAGGGTEQLNFGAGGLTAAEIAQIQFLNPAGFAAGTYSAKMLASGEVVPVGSFLPGDANQDGKVSFADYILLANNFGQTGATWQMGDFNGDGKVSFADYILLANNFGQHTPEPATLGLLLIGGLGLIRRNRK